MNGGVRKAVLAAALAASAFLLAGGSALAFECFNANRSAQGNESAAGAPALISIEEALALFCGLSPERVAEVKEGLEDEGLRTDVLINGQALMAGGLEKNGKGNEKLHDGQGIDHLSDAFFIALGELAPECGEE